MLDGFARHGLFDLTVQCRGDLEVDCHHTIEDVGIALGTAIKEALGDKAGLVRYGSCLLPMDETLALCAVDLGGRPLPLCMMPALPGRAPAAWMCRWRGSFSMPSAMQP